MQNIKNILSNNIFQVILTLFIILLLIIILPGLDNSYVKRGKLYISEIMAKNTYTIKDNFEEYSDYIEIYNGYKEEINLLGYHLSDSVYETNKWTFPEVIIKPDEYLIIYASGKNKCNLDTRECHTNFKLSSKGETIILTDKSGNIINKFSYPSLSNDTSYGFYENKYTILDKATPKYENSNSFTYSKISNQDLYINEYMTHNKRIYYDSEGNYDDFVELYNNCDDNLELHNLFLSDDKDNLMKYKLPDMTLKKNEYLLIFLSDESKVINKEIYANFKLSEDDKYLVLSNGKDIIDIIELTKLIDNVSYGKYDGKWYYFTKPTPGSKNDTVYHEKLYGIE